MKVKRLKDKFLFNYLVKDLQNLEEIVNAGGGYVVPGVSAANLSFVMETLEQINAFKKISKVISVSLGDHGNPRNWKRVLKIALLANPGHINQPFETSSYTDGYLKGIQKPQLVNGLIMPTGDKERVKLPLSNQVIKTEKFMALAKASNLQSIKLMPVKGTEHLEELVHITRLAATYGIKGVEPAGGITVDNIREILLAVKDIDIEFFMPHIFGSAMDPVTMRTNPEIVKQIYEQAKQL